MGVWIETSKRISPNHAFPSHPSWVCGLKHPQIELFGKEVEVTPFVGVWIETTCRYCAGSSPQVTPFVGVWIETPMLGRAVAAGSVTPFVGVWIETRGL